MYNQITIIGHLGKDPEVRSTSGGTAVANFSVATSETYKDKNGEKKTTTQWHRVVAWEKLATLCEKYIKKGSKVLVVGQMEYRDWEKDGVKRTSAEIRAREVKFLDSKPEGSAGSRPEADDQREPGGDDEPF